MQHRLQSKFQRKNQRIECCQADAQRYEQKSADKPGLGKRKEYGECRIFAILLPAKTIKADKSKYKRRPRRPELNMRFRPMMPMHEHEEEAEHDGRQQRLKSMPLLPSPLQKKPQGSGEDAAERRRCRRAAKFLHMPTFDLIRLTIRKHTHANKQYGIKNHRRTKTLIAALHRPAEPLAHVLYAHTCTSTITALSLLCLFAFRFILSCCTHIILGFQKHPHRQIIH